MAMAAPAKRLPVHARVRLGLWVRSASSAILVCWVMVCGSAKAQTAGGIGDQDDSGSSVHGKVLNRVTQEPISRALVFSPDQRYATLTDDRGRFEFRFPPQVPEPKEEQTATPDAEVFRARRLRMMQNARPAMFFVRKPGFLQNANRLLSGRVTANQSEIVIYLDPESLIVGQVNIPGSEGDMRIRVELYQRNIREGQEHWDAVKTFTTWADGEFRFSELSAGTYKLGTGELLDRDPLVSAPGGQLFGFPPIFYPGATDFSSASAIQLAAGTTFQASLSPTRREYYPVKIPVANAAVGQSMNIRVYPLGHPGPGYSLGYNAGEEVIQGLLPEGNYTLRADSQGQTGSTGMANFTVSGGPSEGPAINLIPNASLTVTVREEFQSGQSAIGESTGGADEGLLNNARQRRRVDVEVVLMPDEEFGSGGAAASEPVENSQEYALVIPNVRPGRYRVHVQNAAGYAASVLMGGSDLLRQPLVVGIGGSSTPIEITLRDDGAEVDGQVEEAAPSHIYLLPVGESGGQFRETMSTPDGSFALSQVPPGSYCVLAFDRQQDGLAYNDAEVMRKLESKGEVIEVDAGQKQHLRLKIIAGGDSQ
jgi:hypothetical protein